MPFGPVESYATLVGSREITYYQFMLMRLAGEMTCLNGRRGRSGLAPGADIGGYEGARLCSRFQEIGFDNYLPDATMFDCEKFGYWKPNPDKHIFDATTFTDTYEQAQQYALEARGSFNGLYRNGILLHTRNTYQVLGHTLDKPSGYLVCSAQPIGRRGNVKGGTNTAVMLARRFNIPVRNLWLQDVQASLLLKAQRIADQLHPSNQQCLEKCLSEYHKLHPSTEGT